MRTISKPKPGVSLEAYKTCRKCLAELAVTKEDCTQAAPGAWCLCKCPHCEATLQVYEEEFIHMPAGASVEGP